MNPGPTLRRCGGCFGFLLLALQTAELQSAESDASGPAPYPTGSHFQLVRKFYSVPDGLPAEEIRAVAVTRDGIVLVSAGKGVARLESERWVEQTGPAAVTALFGPIQGPSGLAGATNGVWSLNNGQWQIEAGSPARVIAFAAEPDGTSWALAPGGVWRRGDSWKLIHEVDDDQMKGPRSLLPTGPEDVFVASATGLYGLMGKRKYWLDLEVRPGELLSTGTRALARLDRNHFFVATDKGLNLTDGQRGWHSFTGADGLPILDLTGVAVAGDGTVWLGSNDGLVRWEDGRWTYLASKRWLPDNHVTAIAPAAEGAVWVGTSKGLAHIHHRQMTLADKAAIYQKDLESRDRRYGYVTIMHLPAPGVLNGALQEIS
ncbi:MAG TPA: two-component regulator propeller domain-containing protein, partial [Pyrinomonadaceae bacterium]|nr:two-component regulator propeller domain-containing protein [Pyrinomonadaceae bacterium]